MNQSSMRCMFQLNTQHSRPPLETMSTLRLKYITQFHNNNELSMGQHKYFLFCNVSTIALLFIGHICPTNTTKQADLTAEGQVHLLFESRS